jgi:SAM-dependent methyltransferase
MASMADHDWNELYASDFLPWDSKEPDEALVDAVRAGLVAPGRTLEIGCGTGVNALFLARQAFDVLGVDIAPRAIERARARPAQARCRFEALDFLTATPAGGPFDFVFDRGCWHVFDDAADRERFAARVAELLAPGGKWLSLIGSIEGPPREMGPPRRSARDIMAAIEPALEIVELRSSQFDLEAMQPPKAWRCLSRRREAPAQPGSRRD